MDLKKSNSLIVEKTQFWVVLKQTRIPNMFKDSVLFLHLEVIKVP